MMAEAEKYLQTSICQSSVQFGEDCYSKTMRRGKSHRELDKNWQFFVYHFLYKENRVARFLMCHCSKERRGNVMQKFGKCSMAIVIALVLSLTLFTSGVFAQSINQSATHQKARTVSTTSAVVPSESSLAAGEIGWGGGCGFGWFGCGGSFFGVTHFVHIVSITRFTRIVSFNHFGGFGGCGFWGGCGGFDGW
jgi:hypothetical protein